MPDIASPHSAQAGSVEPPKSGYANRFRYVSSLGAGAMGSVTLAEDTELHRHVAVKTLKEDLCRDEEFRKRIERECLLHAKVGSHPHIVTLYDRYESGGQIHLVMEYVEGETLQKLLERNAEKGVVLALGDALIIGAQCLEALSRIHAQGVVHRDIKPSNIMAGHDENGAVCAKLMDFGVARLTSDDEQLSRLTTTDSGGPGTPLYMAPEQIDSKTFGEISPATDVYAMGILLFQLFTGSPPFRGTLTEVLNAHVNVPAPRIEKVAKGKIPRSLGDILEKALAKKQKHRYRSAKEFRDALLRIGSSLSETWPSAPASWSSLAQSDSASGAATRPTGFSTADTRLTSTTVIRMLMRRKRNLVTLGVGLLIFALMAAGSIAWLVSNFRPDTAPEVASREMPRPEGRQVVPPNSPLGSEEHPDAAPAEMSGDAAVTPAVRTIEPAPLWYIRLARMDWKNDWDTVVVAPEFVAESPLAATPAQDGAGPSGPGAAPASVGPGDRTCIVQPGDSLSKIAGRYGLDVLDIQWWNNIKDPHTLAVGQTLLLYPPDGLLPREQFFAQINTPVPPVEPAPEANPAPPAADTAAAPQETPPEEVKPEKQKKTLKDVWRKIRQRF